MRTHARQKDIQLMNFRLSDRKTITKPVSKEVIQSKIGKEIFEEERDIFDFLDMEYVEPENRIHITASKV